MKIKLTLFVAFFALLTFTSCEDNPLEGSFVDETGIESGNGVVDTGGGTGGGTGTITSNSSVMKLNGIAYPGLLHTISDSIGGEFSIQTLGAGNDGIAFVVPLDVIPGTYAIDGMDYRGSYYSLGSTLFATAYQGTITISTHDTTAHTISGTFEFTASENNPPTPDFVVTNGVFTRIY